jgi:hypothetical protein
MSDIIITTEAFELTSKVYKLSKLEKVPIIYQLEGTGPFIIDIYRKDYKVLFLPFFYKNLPIIFNKFHENQPIKFNSIINNI